MFEAFQLQGAPIVPTTRVFTGKKRGPQKCRIYAANAATNRVVNSGWRNRRESGRTALWGGGNIGKMLEVYTVAGNQGQPPGRGSNLT